MTGEKMRNQESVEEQVAWLVMKLGQDVVGRQESAKWCWAVGDHHE